MMLARSNEVLEQLQLAHLNPADGQAIAVVLLPVPDA